MTDQPVQVPLVDLSNVIEVNPNALHDRDPSRYIALISEVQRVPEVDQVVTVAQTDDDPDEPRYISTAHVVDVDVPRGMIILDVDWQGFHDEVPPPVAVWAGVAFQRLRDHIAADSRNNWVVDVTDAFHFVVGSAPATSAIASSHTESPPDLSDLRLALAP